MMYHEALFCIRPTNNGVNNACVHQNYVCAPDEFAYICTLFHENKALSGFHVLNTETVSDLTPLVFSLRHL